MAAAPPSVEDERAQEAFAVDFDSVRAAHEGAGGGFNARKAVGVVGAALVPLTVGVAEASAKGGEFGIWEGRTASFVHPVIMAGMFALSIRAGILGLQWRELRTMGGKISSLKEQLPMLSAGKRATSPLAREVEGITAALAALEHGDEAPLKADLAVLSSAEALAIEAELEQLGARRKELSAKGVRDRHFDMGALLLGLGTFAAIEGPVNTFIRAQKLFPGPHLYVGAGIVVAWAVAAAMVPQMQKGNELARFVHIGINFGTIGFFAWQVVTGTQIALKVWEFTSWP